MDENLTFKKPAAITVEAAATLGVGLLTACLGLVSGLQIKLEPHSAADPNEWIIILGASSSVGQYSVQDSTKIFRLGRSADIFTGRKTLWLQGPCFMLTIKRKGAFSRADWEFDSEL